jgi:hypothetical protein
VYNSEAIIERTIPVGFFVIHDSTGKISGIATSPPDAPQTSCLLDPGLAMTEVEPPDSAAVDLEAPESSAQVFTEVIENYRVELTAATATLTRRSYKSD